MSTRDPQSNSALPHPRWSPIKWRSERGSRYGSKGKYACSRFWLSVPFESAGAAAFSSTIAVQSSACPAARMLNPQRRCAWAGAARGPRERRGGGASTGAAPWHSA
jgi:hypothetical protein